jgi:hypothetical protein
MPVNAFPKSLYTNDTRIDYFQKLDIADGSWTFLDTLGWVKTQGNTGTTNYVSLNAVASGTDDYSLTGNGTNVTNAPRWYKLAYYDDGTPVVAGDKFQITMLTDMRGSTAVALRYFNWAFGFAQDPTLTNVPSLNFNGAGIAWNFANADSDTFSYIVTAQQQGNGNPLSALDTHSYSTIPVVGGQANFTNVSLDPSGVYRAWTAYTGTTYSYTGQVYLMFAFGMRGSARAYNDDDATEFRINYKISKLNTGDL